MDEGLAKIRHDRSIKDFPFLTLEPDEYVEFAFRRARSTLVLALGGLGAGLIVILLAFLLILLSNNSLIESGQPFFFIILGSLVAAVLLAGIITLVIYQGNRLFITNRHIIQMTMDSPLSNSTNIIDLASVEDVSFHQSGIIEKLFGFGTLRLSTVGDETTYTFKDSDVNSNELKAISKLITTAKHQSTTKD